MTNRNYPKAIRSSLELVHETGHELVVLRLALIAVPTHRAL